MSIGPTGVCRVRLPEVDALLGLLGSVVVGWIMVGSDWIAVIGLGAAIGVVFIDTAGRTSSPGIELTIVTPPVFGVGMLVVIVGVVIVGGATCGAVGCVATCTG